jgi:hypothetical protein
VTRKQKEREETMRRKILIAVLALGTVGGYASGFAHLRHAHQRCSSWRHAAAEPACAESMQNAPKAQPKAEAPNGESLRDTTER